MTTTTLEFPEPPGICPICLGPTTETAPGFERCPACGWQGSAFQTKESFHGED